MVPRGDLQCSNGGEGSGPGRDGGGGAVDRNVSNLRAGNFANHRTERDTSRVCGAVEAGEVLNEPSIARVCLTNTTQTSGLRT